MNPTERLTCILFIKNIARKYKLNVLYNSMSSEYSKMSLDYEIKFIPSLSKSESLIEFKSKCKDNQWEYAINLLNASIGYERSSIYKSEHRDLLLEILECEMH